MYAYGELEVKELSVFILVFLNSNAIQTGFDLR